MLGNTRSLEPELSPHTSHDLTQRVGDRRKVTGTVCAVVPWQCARMELLLRASSSIGVFLILVFGVMLTKRVGLLQEEHGRLCSTLIVKVTLPALIFVTLLHADFSCDYAKMSAILLGASAICLGLGWLLARAFKLDGPRTAPVILSVGSAAPRYWAFP